MKKNNDLFFQYTHDYLEIYLKKQVGRSINTVESYRDALTVFRKYLYEEKKITIMKFRISDCTKDLILDYIDYLKRKNKKESTINHHITAIKGYLWYVSDKNITYQSVAISVSHIPLLKIPKKEKEILSDEVLKLFFTIQKNNKIGIRNKTILIMLYETAVRVGELTNIRLCDIVLNTNSPYILIHGKGDKERIVNLSDKATEHLKYYISVFQPTDYLFFSVIKGKTGPLSESTIETFIDKYTNEIKTAYPDITVPKKVHPHMFRRSRATHLYQDDVPLELVSRMLGHSSIETTKIYAKPSNEQMRRIIENENDIDIKPEWESEEELAKLLGIR